MAQEHSRQELLDLYRIALEEYRFEVKLNTDRMIHYIVFNTALLSVGAGLLKIAADLVLNAFVALLFLIGIFTTWMARRAIRRGHKYYRQTIYKKTLVEDLLGLHQPVKDYPGATLAITTTDGQAQVHQTLYDSGSIERPLRKGSIAHAGIVVLWLLTIANAAGIAAATAPAAIAAVQHFMSTR